MTNKIEKIDFNVPTFETQKRSDDVGDLSRKFYETYKIKNITDTVPTNIIPKSESECYVRYVSGATYKLYVYLGKAVGWKSVTLS